jgi:hypothetical protein
MTGSMTKASDNLVERVARAIYAENPDTSMGNATRSLTWEETGAWNRLLHCKMARAAIEATRIEKLQAALLEAGEFVRTYPTTKRIQVTIPAHEDLTSMGSLYTVPESKVWRNRPTTFADCAADLLELINTHDGRDA